ncbi:MAG: hypothetical protein ABWY03_01175 [Microbacterium sp.]
MTTTTHHARRPVRRAAAAVPPAVVSTTDFAQALTSAADARIRAEHDLRASELVRRRAGHALEQDLRPMRIDEATRAALRADYAAADAEVARRRQALDRAVRLDDAAREIAGAVAESEDVQVEGLGGILIAWSRLRDAVSGPRFSPA